jgi:Leucine-rich repeat (LRR) protein
MGGIRKMIRAGWGQHSYLSTGACLNLGFWLLLGVTTCCLADIPTITLEPMSRKVVLYTVGPCVSGDCRAVHFVSAATSDAPLTYQWLKDGLPAGDNGRISGVAESELVIRDVQIEDAGAYSFVASNAAGSVTSAPAVLKVTVPVLKDLRLEDAVRRELGKPEGEISCSDLERLTNLVAFDQHIKSLAGIECARNLRLMWVGGNYLEDLSPVSGLNELRQLAAYNNHGKLKDLSGVRGLTNLTYLDVRCNPGITNLNIAGELSHLQELYLGGNEIGEIGFVTNLTELKTLDIGAGLNVDLTVLGLLPSVTQLDVSYGTGMDLRLIGGLTNLETLSISGINLINPDWVTNLSGLKTLNAVGTGLTDIPPLNGLTNLESLNLGRNAISDTSTLSPLQSLQSLWLYDNQITNSLGLGAMAALQVLNLDRNQISEIGSASLPFGLKALCLEGNGITKLSEISGLIHLEELSLGANRIEEIAVTNLRALRSLSLFNNQLAETSALRGLSNLVYVDLSNNRLSNGATYSAMTQLDTLKIAGNKLQELTWVAGLQQLRELDVSDNGINDATSISNLPALRILGVGGNALSDWSVLTGLTNLEQINIARNGLEQPGFLSALGGLKDLDLSGNLMTNLAGVVTLTNLERLDASGNRLMEISGLACLPRMGEVDLRRNLLGSSQTALAALSCLDQGQIEVVSSPQRIGPSITFTNMGRRYGSNYWPMALGETAQVGFTIRDDVVPEGPFLVSVEVSDLALLPQGTVALQGAGTNGVLTIRAPTTKMGQCTVTIQAIDSLGVRVLSPVIVEFSEPTEIMDPQLESQIRSELGVQVQQLTRGAIEALQTLNAGGLNITNLSGLELATNLTRLDLGGNAILRIEPILGLVGLNRLSLSNNLLTDISGIRGLTKLTELNLSDNPVTNFEALSELRDLNTLFLVGNRIEDLSFVSNLKQLVVLDLATNSLGDIVALRGLTDLSWLGLEQNRLKNLDLLTNLTRLTYIDGRLNLLAVDIDPVLEQLALMAILLDDPQRESPFVDIRTNWVMNAGTTSTLAFNVRDTGPADQMLGVGIISTSATEVSFQLLPPGPDGAWQLLAIPLVQAGESNLVLQVTVAATNDVGLISAKDVTVVVTKFIAIDGNFFGGAGLTWRNNGDALWFGETWLLRDGHPVAQSGVVPNFGVSALETDLMGPGRLSFWWKVSSEENYDWLTFTLGEETHSISGEVDWERRVVNVPPGLQTARWEYRKDENASHGFDAGWVDQVTFERGIWMEPPVPQGDGGVTIVAHGVPGRIYELLSSTNWAEWSRIPPAVLVTNVSQALSDTNSAEGFRLYQLHELFLTLDPPIIRGFTMVEIRLHNPTGFKPEVEASMDLVNWVSVGKINDTANGVSILDVFSTNSAPRFYRAMLHW